MVVNPPEIKGKTDIWGLTFRRSKIENNGDKGSLFLRRRVRPETSVFPFIQGGQTTILGNFYVPMYSRADVPHIFNLVHTFGNFRDSTKVK